MKTVKEVSKLTDISVRVLHHYDAIGLLKPAQVMNLFTRLGKMRPCAPDRDAAQNWAKAFQDFFTE